jgi:hypothetical protein
MAHALGKKQHAKVESAGILRMATRARQIAEVASPGVAELFIHHAEMCERGALRPIAPQDHLIFDDKGNSLRARGEP